MHFEKKSAIWINQLPVSAPPQVEAQAQDIFCNFVFSKGPRYVLQLCIE
jgi:hypothetical protein